MMDLAPHAAVVLAAVLLDLAFGDPRRLPHPVIGIGRLVSFLERVLRRAIPHERTAGVVLLVLTVGTTAGAAQLLIMAAHAVGSLIGYGMEVYLSFTCLAAKSLHRESEQVAAALRQGDLKESRRRLSFIVGRDTDNLEEREIWRANVETVAENSSDGVVAPLLYLMIGGPVLALAYKGVNTLDSMVGYKNDRYLRFGWAAARFDDLVNWVPARVTGLLMVAAALPLGLSARGAWTIMRRDGRNHSSPNSGVPEAAAAGALGVQLGGASSYFGVPVAKPTIGDAEQELGDGAYRGAVRLMYGAETLLVVTWGSGVLLWG